jgi:hypothetical protein
MCWSIRGVPDTRPPPCTHSSTPRGQSLSEVDTNRPRTSPKRTPSAPFGDRHACPNTRMDRRAMRRLIPRGCVRSDSFRLPDIRLTSRWLSGLGSSGTGLGAK